MSGELQLRHMTDRYDFGDVELDGRILNLTLGEGDMRVLTGLKWLSLRKIGRII